MGIDCPLGWPRTFVAFVAAHAADRPLPTMGPDTRSLRLRTTDIAVHRRLGLTPLSVSTNLLGVTALRAARILTELRDGSMPVDRAGRDAVCEVYPAASRAAWGLPKARDVTFLLDQLPLAVAPADSAQFDDEHIFDALIAALTARAVAMGLTDWFPADQEDLAAEEGLVTVRGKV